MLKSFLFIFLMVFSVSGKAKTTSIDSAKYVNDTIYPNSFTWEGFISTSCFANLNWKDKTNFSVNIYGSLYLAYRKTRGRLKTIHEFRSQLGYIKYIDSVWVKPTDVFYISSIWTVNSSHSINTSFSAYLKSQLTDSWKNVYLPDQKRKWLSGPFLPASLILGYGINKTFEGNSYINCSFASLKINSRPHLPNSNREIKNAILTEKIIYNSEYGFQLQWLFNKKIFTLFTWENRTNFFATGFDKNTITFDFQNAISIKPVRFMKIRLEQLVIYDRLQSEKIQTRIELMIGLSFDK